MASLHPEVAVVVNGMTELISDALRRLYDESAHPGYNPDATDDSVKQLRERIAYLRRVRNEFENLMYCPWETL